METLDSSIFDLTPIPMWIEDFSEVKQLFDLWRNQGVENLYEFLSQNENLVVECAHKIKIWGCSRLAEVLLYENEDKSL
ncbi:hypothetical protein XC15_11430 [Acinetobacter baumannii]|nr:hypothetical protein [Acinetobacter baumannii]MDR8132748.1 hypothetical protein [Acinetobacter baumannii]MDR8145432.1 hypothetical protein [Acinetobacter baumannii]